VNADERVSQLSAMFDGELPAAECELLSRRLARDEQLRATWSRYAVIGAVLRAEPVAQVRPDFAHRVSEALDQKAGNAPWKRMLRNATLGSAIAAGVAGAAIMLLRNGLPAQDGAILAAAIPHAKHAVQALSARANLPGSINLRVTNAAALNPSHEMFSYVTPPLSNENSGAVSASLADYVVAHSEVPSSLARGSLLSVLVGNPQLQPVPEALQPDDGR